MNISYFAPTIVAGNLHIFDVTCGIYVPVDCELILEALPWLAPLLVEKRCSTFVVEG